MTYPTLSHSWVINHYVSDQLDGSELEWVEKPLPALQGGEVLIETKLLSLDASNLLWLSEVKDYLPQLAIGDVMRGMVIGRVHSSNHSQFIPGEHLFAMSGWTDYSISHGDTLLAERSMLKINPHPDIPLDAYVGTLGVTGWSAYIGMIQVGRVRAGDTVLVSGAAGATGLMACQIAKAAGAKVYGLAGGERKCAFLKDVVQLEDAIDYKAVDNLADAIAAAIPQGVNVFFDNVGGVTLEAGIDNMAKHGCVVASGSVSEYNKVGNRDSRHGIKNLGLITTKRLRIEGFLITDHFHQVAYILKEMEQWLLEGKLINKNQIVNGLENAQAALPKLVSGGNTGKLAITC
jgi:NADPH-dependent curcumin reductase CurA